MFSVLLQSSLSSHQHPEDIHCYQKQKNKIKIFFNSWNVLIETFFLFTNCKKCFKVQKLPKWLVKTQTDLNVFLQ